MGEFVHAEGFFLCAKKQRVSRNIKTLFLLFVFKCFLQEIVDLVTKLNCMRLVKCKCLLPFPFFETHTAFSLKFPTISTVPPSPPPPKKKL